MQGVSDMKTKILKTKEDYNLACERVFSLINSTAKPIDQESKEGEELELLSLLIEKYEQEHFPLELPDSIEAIKFRMDQMNLKQADIAPIFGGKTRVSEVLNRKRPLTLKMITLLNQYLGIPFESLMKGDKNMFLEPEKRNRLLKVSQIREYFLKHNKASIL